MKVPILRVLFKRVTETNVSALRGLSRGEYDLRLGRQLEIGQFFDGLAPQNPTQLGGWDKQVTFEPMDGPDSVPPETHRIRFMGPGSGRKDFYFASQQPGKSYTLWSEGRAFPEGALPPTVAGDVLLLLRDVNDGIHTRWIRKADIPSLPPTIAADVTIRDLGLIDMPAAGARRTALVQRVLTALKQHHNVLLYGPPATGKTHLVSAVLEAFATSGLLLDTEEERTPLSLSGGDVHTAWATFHQSYSYEDFLLGLRPDPQPEGGFRLEPVPGVLLELAEWARGDGRSSLLVIDEINRGNVSRIFGEFITLMEPDKRLDDNGEPRTTTVGVRLPFLKAGVKVQVPLPGDETAEVSDRFQMPNRVYTLATMNSVDTSVAPLDAALRRRFYVIDLFPDIEAFRAELGAGEGPAELPEIATTIADVHALALTLLRRLNEKIAMFLGTDFQFGQWYFAPLVGANDDEAAREALVSIWRTRVFPQLEEHFIGRVDQLLAVLGQPGTSDRSVRVDKPSVQLEELGAVTALGMRPEASTADVLRLMRVVATT